MIPRARTARSVGAKPARRIRYHVACSLDGYIADEAGGADWILHEPEIDFAGIFAQFDTLRMGRRTYEPMIGASGPGTGDKEVVVVSRTLRPEDHPGVTIVFDRLEERVRELRALPGKDIWLFGGGELFRSLLELGLVDSVEPAIIPRPRRRPAVPARPRDPAAAYAHEPPRLPEWNRVARVRGSTAEGAWEARSAGDPFMTPCSGPGAEVLRHLYEQICRLTVALKLRLQPVQRRDARDYTNVTGAQTQSSEDRVPPASSAC